MWAMWCLEAGVIFQFLQPNPLIFRLAVAGWLQVQFWALLLLESELSLGNFLLPGTFPSIECAR
jgi:hypothetical protein